jgi:hypothetical protein
MCCNVPDVTSPAVRYAASPLSNYPTVPIYPLLVFHLHTLSLTLSFSLSPLSPLLPPLLFPGGRGEDGGHARQGAVPHALISADTISTVMFSTVQRISMLLFLGQF